VYVSKAGKQATLPAETALLAAANPTGGHYDFTEHFAEQVGLQSPLLSRFDLVFVMTESQNPDHLETVASHMVDSRTTAGKLARGEELADAEREAIEPPIDRDVLTAYIAHARSQARPVIRDPAVKDRIVEWFLELKGKLPDRTDDDAPPLPVTARKLDAVCRLSEASARAAIREEITADDVERATRLIDRSLADIGIAPDGQATFGSADAVDAGEVGL
jgi:replicative DNA helicase Mcm